MPFSGPNSKGTRELSEWRGKLDTILGEDSPAFETASQVLDFVKERCIDREEKDFRRARLAMTIARELDPQDVHLAQQHAIFTYKDPEFAPARRYAAALEILESVGLRTDGEQNPETLRLAGAIYKRMWSFDGRMENLIQSYAFYRGVFDQDPEEDKGYGGVNAAFILDLRAARARILERRSGTTISESAKLEADAKALRENVVFVLDELIKADPEPKQDEWIAPTCAEAHFGLGIYDECHYEAARQWLSKSRGLGGNSWQFETTFKQLVSLAKAQGIELPNAVAGDALEKRNDDKDWHPAWQALKAAMGDETRHALECYRGRVGLALSGGGFRASLYHIGVPARLAEMDALRSVEAISTVSGGSILGAQYYLELQKLLEEREDGCIDTEDYLEIVERLHQAFPTGVRRNLRMRAFIDPIKNWRMLGGGDYDRSARIGELYEKELYTGVDDDHTRNATGARRKMTDLLISSQQKEMDPNKTNWRRWARLPVLLLNTTTLNSGHNWQFTAKWMGEPPGLLGEQVDKNRRYRRVYYDRVPKGVRSVSLGEAVAASACVPGVFEPMEIQKLYDGHDIRLVDGGVHDNQGVAGLLDEGCTLVLCSDASGQKGDESAPSNRTIGVPLRANSIIMDRVREAQYQDLAARVGSGALQGLFYVHLKEAIPTEDVSWQGARDDFSKLGTPKEGYAIRPALQAKIAATRTDLDCFSEVEANSLMLSGYLMTEWKFQQLQEQHEREGGVGNWGDFRPGAPREDDRWSFLDPRFVKLFEEEAEVPSRGAADLDLQLDVGSSSFFRAFQLIPMLTWFARAAALIAFLGCVYGLVSSWNRPVAELIGFEKATLGGVAIALLIVGIGSYRPVAQWLNPQSVATSSVRRVIAGCVLAAGSMIQVHVIDRLLRRRGSMERLLEL